MKRYAVLAVMLGLVLPAFAESFVSGTFFVGYTAAQGIEWSDSSKIQDWTFGVSANLVSRAGLLVTAELYDAYQKDYGSTTFAGAGFGLSISPVRVFSLDSALLILADPATGYTILGPRAGVTFWFGDVGITAQAAYYSQLEYHEYQWISFRAGISVRR